MKHFSLILLPIFLFSTFALGEDVKLLSASGERTCVVADEGLKCWGIYGSDRDNAPKLSNIKLLSVGLIHTCAVADEGLKCWGSNEYGQLNAPKLSNIRLLSAGVFHTCAVADEGLKCWGSYDGSNRINAPKLSNIKLLSTGYDHTCAVADEELKCWGKNEFGQLNAPKLSNIKLLSVGDAHTCAVANEGLKCWGSNRYGQLNAPKLSNIKLLSVGDAHTCAVANEGLKCWGSNEYGQLNAPKLSNIKLISVGEKHTCAVADEGLKCWGMNGLGYLYIPESFLNPRFGALNVSESLLAAHLYSFFPKLDKGLIALSKVSYPYKRTFFEDTAKMVAHVPENASTSATYLPGLQNAFILNAIAPVIENTDSAVFKTEAIPAFTKSQTEMNERFEISSLSDIELRASVLRAALQLSANALTACRDYVAENEARESLETFLSQIAGLIAENPNPSGMASTTAINKAQILFETHSALIQKLSNEKRTRGFGLMLLEISHYLSKEH